MVSINIGAGQGITQAIATKLGLKGQDLKKISLSTWQNVMTEVNNAQSQIDKHNASTQNDKQKSIFTGGRDVNAINQKSNFVVQQGSVEINESSWNKIVQLLTGQSSEIKSNNKEVTFDGGELAEVTVTGKAPDLIKKVDYSPNMDIEQLEISGLDIPQSNSENIIDLSDVKVIQREVNGKKQQIGVFEDENGNKVRRLVTTDPETGKTTLGENLVAVSTMGKNKYVTESKFNADVKYMLGLGADEEIPSDLKAEYITIGGESQLVIKKDGKVMDSAQSKEYMSNYRANEQITKDQNIKSCNDNGYVLDNFMINGQETPVYQKDGKTYLADPKTFTLSKEIGFTYTNESDGSKSEYIYTDNNGGHKLVRTIASDGYIREYIDENNQLYKDDKGEIQFKLENGKYYKYDKGNYMLISGNPFE